MKVIVEFNNLKRSCRSHWPHDPEGCLSGDGSACNEKACSLVVGIIQEKEEK